MTINVGVNGMGRIGRMVIRAIIESQNKNIKIKHINNRSNSEASCTLIKYDSVHENFNADFVIWIDTIKEGRFDDTNKMFQVPNKVDIHIKEWNEHNHIDVADSIKKWKK